MTTENLIIAFSKLGTRLQNLTEEQKLSLITQAKNENPWFTEDNIKLALSGSIKFLNRERLTEWLSSYTIPQTAKTVATVMAGNIPLVGFHDFLSVLLSGHSIQIKLSSKDSVLLKFIIGLLIEINPALQSRITITERLANFDAVIATGSDNSSRYFDYYFSKYPNIIRKNRTSCAILTGEESDNDFQVLGNDVFSYFGLGCRNVSKLFVPEGYDFIPLLNKWEVFNEIGNHHKFHNNYDYQKSIMLVNGIHFLDNGFVMLTENERLVSPISVVYFEYYKSKEGLQSRLKFIEDKLQCIVGNSSLATVPFGKAQYPELEDFADGVDTLKFLTSLN